MEGQHNCEMADLLSSKCEIKHSFVKMCIRKKLNLNFLPTLLSFDIFDKGKEN